MNNRVLKHYIESFKNQKTEVFSKILHHYKKILNYYANRLEGEDAKQELNLFFVELLFKINTEKFVSDSSYSLACYISASIRNKYIEISKYEARHKLHCMPFFENCFESAAEIDLRLEMEEMLELLSEKQRAVIIAKYFHLYSDVEIAEILGISRQAVNHLKNRALETLRRFYL